MTLIGLDFSINKPAACIYHNKQYKFIGWPYGLSDKLISTYNNSGANLIARTDDKEKGDNSSEQMRYQVSNAKYIANLMFDSLKEYLNEDTHIGFEGLSFGSTGDIVLQLGGYKYILMDRFNELVPFENMYTYAPISVKSTAKCAKRGMNKVDMINAFIDLNIDSDFRRNLKKDKETYMKKGGKNFIDHLDDLVDAFWVLETMRIKNKLV